MEQPVTLGRATRSSGEGPETLEALVGEALTARVTLDDRGTVTGWNAGAERLLGYSAGQMTGRRAADLLAEPIPVRGGMPALAGLPRWNGDVALRHRDGRKLTVRLLAHHREPGTGAPAWLIVSALTGEQPRPDLDDALVSWSFAQSPCCALALYDTRLRLRRANADMERSVALTEEEMRGLRVCEIVDNDAGVRAELSMARVLRTGEPQYDENYLRAPGEDHEHAWSVFTSALRDEEGTIRGVCLSAHDMTEQFWARKRLQLIAEAGRRIGSTLDVTRTAQELADVTVPVLADFVSVDLLAELDDLHEPPAHRVPADGPLLLRRVALRSVTPGVPEAVGPIGRVESYPEGSAPFESMRTGRPAVHAVTDAAVTGWPAYDPARAARVRTLGIHSVMTVPLAARGTTLGVAFFVRYRTPEPFRHDDQVLAGELAARAAVSIDNARRYSRERATAVTLQRSLLPQRLPRQAAVEVASRYLPAGAHAGVGGDWFDVIPLSGARVALVVGDVVGHGLHASATMGRLRTAVRTLADIDLPCDELLTHLDDLVARLSTEEEDGDARGGAAAGSAAPAAPADASGRAAPVAPADGSGRAASAAPAEAFGHAETSGHADVSGRAGPAAPGADASGRAGPAAPVDGSGRAASAAPAEAFGHAETSGHADVSGRAGPAAPGADASGRAGPAAPVDGSGRAGPAAPAEGFGHVETSGPADASGRAGPAAPADASGHAAPVAPADASGHAETSWPADTSGPAEISGTPDQAGYAETDETPDQAVYAETYRYPEPAGYAETYRYPEPAGYAETSGDVGATCLYVVYDPVSRRCCLAGAGHPVPAVVSPDGTVGLVGLPAAPPLGVGGLPYEATEVELPEGSLLALYTNGLIETRDRDLDDGVHRLREALARPAPSLDALCDRVLADLLPQPQRPSDDVALLIARTRALDANQVATWAVPDDPSAVAQTRKDVVAQLERWGLSDAVFVTELVVSELVTNAIRHAEPPIQLRLIHDTTLICEVSDGGNTAPHLRRARSYDEGGRGLLLVAQLTERWGTRQGATGKTIWAEQSLSVPSFQ
ncbi:SpoIIE family protein phosphatase [Streptomyces lomondensis]|nr:SpoIIE family protein phosphatase [Streptomyces lomondensis]MCF0080276.1 SpoIIE family protein phosphatase [Streptomyces lomondensis]